MAWQSVKQAFLTVRIKLNCRKKQPRTVSSNYVNRVKCHDLYNNESDYSKTNCRIDAKLVDRLNTKVPGGYSDMHDACVMVLPTELPG